jgi:hypothetical protein
VTSGELAAAIGVGGDVVLFAVILIVAFIVRRRRRRRPIPIPFRPEPTPDERTKAREQYADLELAEARTRLAAATEDATRVTAEFARLVAQLVKQLKTKETK